MKATIRLKNTEERDFRNESMVDVEIIYYSDDETMQHYEDNTPFYSQQINKLIKTEIKSKQEI